MLKNKIILKDQGLNNLILIWSNKKLVKDLHIFQNNNNHKMNKKIALM